MLHSWSFHRIDNKKHRTFALQNFCSSCKTMGFSFETSVFPYVTKNSTHEKSFSLDKIQDSHMEKTLFSMWESIKSSMGKEISFAEKRF